jgi:hypothetical protein
MPPKHMSRHTFTEGTVLSDLGEEELFLTERVPYTYREFSDNEVHVAGDNDTLWSLAGHYFRGLPNPSRLWWIIADFQPQRIIDPTIKLRPGTVLAIPSVRTVLEEVLSEKRRKESVL